MDSLPFDPSSAADGFSNVSALIAGFSLTALILLIERLDKVEPSKRDAYIKGIWMVFIALVSNLLTAFLYASAINETLEPKIALYTFMIAGNVFAISFNPLFVSLNILLSSLNHSEILNKANFVLFMILAFGNFRLLSALFAGFKVFNQEYSEFLFYAVGFLPLLCSGLIFFRWHNWIKNKFPNLFDNSYIFGLVVIIVSFIFALTQTRYDFNQSSVSYSVELGLISMLVTSILSGWCLLLSPRQTLEELSKLPLSQNKFLITQDFPQQYIPIIILVLLDVALYFLLCANIN